MLAAIGLVDVVYAGLGVLGTKGTSLQSNESSEAETAKSDQILPAERNIFVYVLLYLIFCIYQFGLGLSNATLYPADQEAMSWVREHTPGSSRFLVLTGTSSVSCDSVLEWFPALTGQQSIFTVQGTEWTQGNNFTAYVTSTYPAQRCLTSGDASCLDAAVSRSAYDFIYLSKILHVDNCVPLAPQRTFPDFLEHMRADSRFQTIYETDGVIIFGK